MGKKFTGEQLELFQNISDFRRVYEIADDLLVEHVWADRRLQKLLWRKFVFSLCGKVRAEMRTEKMDAYQRYASALHAAQVRWAKEKGRPVVSGNGYAAGSRQ